MLSKIHKFKVTITEKDLDTFGHVNNATYLELYEQARWDLITENDYGLSEIKALKLGPVVLRAEVFYKAEITNRDVITIETEVKEFKNSLVMTLEQRMINSSGRVASSANFDFGLFDLEKRKLVPPTKKWLGALGIKEN